MNKLEQIKDKIYKKLNKRQPHDLESEIDLAVKIVAKTIRDDLMKETTMPEEIYYYFKKEWGLE